MSVTLLAETSARTPAGPSPPSLRRDLTYVELVHQPGRIERWIRFGAVDDELVIDRQTRFLGFRPDAILAFVRWASNDFGTAVSRIAILRAVRPGEGLSTVPGVIPGGECLLRVSGWSRVERVLKAIDAVEAIGVEPATAAPDHWRHLHHRLVAGEPPRAYSLERHRAWLSRQALLS